MEKIFDDETEIIESYLERGKNYVIFEKYSDAIEDLTKVIEFLPDDEIYFDKLFMAYYSRGFAYKKLKKYVEAMQDFEKALDFNSNSSEAWDNLGICLQKLFGADDAAWAFDLANAIKNGYTFRNYFGR